MVIFTRYPAKLSY